MSAIEMPAWFGASFLVGMTVIVALRPMLCWSMARLAAVVASLAAWREKAPYGVQNP